ncbi:amino acid ABC transporter substrate-binding protein, PAAT family [Tistlia consotensis]|uniref:Amino acid ABC transporter substrate-binding protein, PAAT family n=1 Tax=Tistlia consotensis USBA 355 TaxID=560819 RepID=A0A1Y6CJU0_9PROT|nr:transporter substrate-binding domain-containing protein [Tistlia consotensis]SMF71044.1 amino acid ABC transporter substrate-binding protein, PAAT family [Tistlia consotensis USBA 355]SNS06792.1 amino acid ABC transporter substrate-binding protein, PAAT family [Tistlia consotensis]
MRAAAYLLLASLLLVAPAAAQQLPDPLKIATEGAYPPFNYLDDQGKVQGFEIDLARAMCDEMKVTCEFVVQDWDGLIPGLLSQKYDAIIASLYITDERRQRIAFSDKYYQVPARFVVPKSSDLKITPEGMKGAVVGTQRATSFERFLRDRFPGIDLRVYATMDEAYLDLKSGRIDALMGDVVAASEGFLKKPDGAGFEFRGPEYTGSTWFGYGAGVGVRKEDAYIAKAFSGAIAKLRANGVYKKLSTKWFGFDVYGG